MHTRGSRKPATGKKMAGLKRLFMSQTSICPKLEIQPKGSQWNGGEARPPEVLAGKEESEEGSRKAIVQRIKRNFLRTSEAGRIHRPTSFWGQWGATKEGKMFARLAEHRSSQLLERRVLCLIPP